MTDYESFEGRVEPLVWGKATYTILRLPEDVADRLRAHGAARVEGEIAEHPVNLALSKAPVVEGTFLWAGQSLLDRIGIAPGERVEVRLRPALSDAVETPGDLEAALHQAGRSVAWESLTPGRRRGLLYRLDTAKRAETRAKRVVEIVESLS